MTESYRTYKPPRLQKSLACPDGKRRSDCVCQDPETHKPCGKAMVGTIPFLGGMRFRLCQEHYTLFTTPAADAGGTRLFVPEGAGSLALKQISEGDFE
jgi:hypothetical protein